MKEIREIEQMKERIEWKVLLSTARCQRQNYKNGNCFNIGREIKKKKRYECIPHSKKRKKIRNNKKAFILSTEHIFEGKKIKQARKETVKLKFSPKVSHPEGSIVSSFHIKSLILHSLCLS